MAMQRCKEMGCYFMENGKARAGGVISVFTVFAFLGSKYKSRIETCVRPARIPDTSQVP